MKTSRLLLLIALLLAGCANQEQPAAADQQASQDIAVVTRRPDQVALAFVEDMQRALAEVQDPAQNSADTRKRWAKLLSDYFVPNERTFQRSSLEDMFRSISNDRRDIPNGESVVFELRFDRNADIPAPVINGPNAAVVIPEARLFLQVLYASGASYEQEVPLANVIGRKDGSIPLININGRWYLTETPER